jgi:hypothetical protein
VASSGAAAASPAVVIELREALRQILGVAGSWIKAGILAVCGLSSSAGTTSSSCRQSAGGAAGGTSSGGASHAAGMHVQEVQLLLQVGHQLACMSTNTVMFCLGGAVHVSRGLSTYLCVSCCLLTCSH